MTATDQALTYLLSPARSGIDPELFVPLLRLLAEGEPVTVAELATASGRSEDTVRQGLAAVPDTEYDDEGRIIGLALTMRPTPHRFTLAGEQLYTWCALDTLFFPALIGKAATIESTSRGSGTLIRVMTGADGTVTSVQPATAVVSITSHPGTVPMLDARCEKFWRERIETIGPGDPLIPAPGDVHLHWRTDNAVKACAALYKDIGVQLEDEVVSSMRSHAWRTVLNNRAIARGVPAEIRSAFFGHTEAMNARNYTDLTDVSAMQSALEGGALDGALEG